MRYVPSVIAEVSPNLYSAASRANLNPTEMNQVEQMSWAIKKHREFGRMTTENARLSYDKLDADAQESLKFFFGDAEYMKEPPAFSDRLVGAVKFAGKALASPLIGLFRVAGSYNKVINSPYLVYRQITQGESIFDAKVWSDAWDGNDIYDNGALNEAVRIFGKEKVFVAKQLLQGRKPGEILEAYGQLTEGITNAVMEAFNEPETFNQVLDATKYAQVSPGRDIVRFLANRPPKNGGLTADMIDGSAFTRGISGTIDFAYQIIIDPLTWITGGTSKAITRGTQLAEMATKAMNNGRSSAEAVSMVFKDAGVRKLWDDQFGPELRKLSEATDAYQRGVIRRKIGQRFSGYNDDDAIEFFVRNKMFDADSAEDVFAQAENTHRLLSGRIDGISYKRNGVATARNQRRLGYGFNRLLDGVFNGATSGKFAIRKTVEEINEKSEKVFDILLDHGTEVDKAINPAVRELVDIDEDLGKFKKTLYFFGKMAARNPGGQFIMVGDDAVKTVGTLRQVARQVLNKDLSDFVAQKFLRSSEDEQIVIIRNLYTAIMMRAGLYGRPEGEEFINEILKKTLNEKAGFTTTTNSRISEGLTKLLSSHTVRVMEGQAELVRRGAIQPSQLASAIAPLPYEEIASVAYNVKSKQNLFYAVGGATKSRAAKNFVDFWSIFTLFPRLGIRSAVDEGIMHALTAPMKDIWQFASGVGRKLGRASAAYTGSDAASPLVLDSFRKLAGRKTPSQYIPLEERNQIIDDLINELNEMNKLSDDLGLTPAEIAHITINKNIAGRAAVFLRGLKDEDKAYWADLMVHHPDAMNAMASSVAAKTISGRIDDAFTTQQINISELTRAMSIATERLRESGKLSKKQVLELGDYRDIDVYKLGQKDPFYVTLAHYDNFFIRFAVPRQHGSLKLPGNYRVAPATVFLQNNGLKTEKDLFRAVGEVMQSVGIEFIGDSYRVKAGAEDTVKKFLSYFGDTVSLRAQGLADEEIVRIYAEGMLLDLRSAFHGSFDFSKYNSALYEKVVDNYRNLAMKVEERGTLVGVAPMYMSDSNLWHKSIASLDLDSFDELTVGFKPEGFINTRIEFQEFTDFPNVFRKYGNQAMEMMDRQLTNILRQPIVNVSYLRYRKMYAGLEREWVDQYIKNEIRENPKLYTKGSDALIALNRKAELLGQKRFAELSLNEALDQTLKFADNPSIRSNLAMSVRTVGRFYRATEDFYRRVYRLKEVSPRVLYRMRLAHLGLNGSGLFHEDADGKPYLMMPMDDVIFKATDTTLRTLLGQTDSVYKQPAFNDFTFKLELLNPSFSPEAGVPQFSGPIAALGVIGIKNLLGNFDNPAAQKVAAEIDNVALGDLGDNITIRRAIVPSTLGKLWAMLPVNEKERQEVTAAQQAVAYNAANGLFITPDATDKEKADYLKNVRITAHNILFLRSFLGLISPVVPTTQDTKGVPDYLLDVGVTGLRSEFFDILTAVQKKYGDDVQDPYELALNIFTGQNPGKIVYTVSKNEKQNKVLIDSTNEMKNWALSNVNFIKTYGEVAYLFGPKTGEFSPSAFNWMRATGLIEDKTLEKYYEDVQVAEDKQKYYDIARWENDELAREGSIAQRKVVIQSATQAREALIQSNPLLLTALTGGGNEVATEQRMMESVRQIIGDQNIQISGDTRIRMKTALQAMDDFLSFVANPEVRSLYNASYLKRKYRENVEKLLKDLSVEDPAVKEATRAIFNSLLSYHSRESYRAVP